MRIGMIGAGFVSQNVAKLAIDRGHEVMMSNSRGPETLFSVAAALGCRTGTAEEAASFGELVLVAVPLTAFDRLPAKALSGRIVMDPNNYYPQRDGAIAELDEHRETTSERLARHLPGARIVKAFNAIRSIELTRDARPAGEAGRRALPIAGDDAEAKRQVMDLTDELGYEPFDAGSLAESWRFERAKPAYCVPLDREGLAEALAAAERDVEVPDGSWRR
ncbi:NADPH-dependent F420 reductase [Jiella avicenniae]|uniref:NAD(P)-binding domain-containing protein n=1 Tax=Jiella avicenniae TaxID=2907202 RepID=A0A9X1T446_9HYPH|nr:NAD(P)-binding domain-containing protein [Jiella avicenniae]MCE7027264.1 NAD(P)-binding domain-containing protein [Jiella avicenniae]